MWASRRPSDGSGAGVRAVPPGVQVSRKVAEVAECDARGDHERAVRLLADWLAMRGRLLAIALLRRRWSAVREESLVFKGTFQGLRYGLSLSPTVDSVSPVRELS